MKKNYFVLTIIAVFAFAMSFPTDATAKEKKEKKKKEKKEFVWKKPAASGDASIDEYLNSCDALYTKINKCKDNISQYVYKETDAFDIDGEKYKLVWMHNPKTNELLSYGMGRWQVAQAIKEAADIVLESTNLSLSTANAALSLPNLGVMKAISYAKYVKDGGPKIIGMGMKEIGHLQKECQQTMRKYGIAKKTSIKPEELTPEFTQKVLNRLNNYDEEKFKKQYYKYVFLMKVVEQASEGVENVEVQLSEEEKNAKFNNDIESLNNSEEGEYREETGDDINEYDEIKNLGITV